MRPQFSQFSTVPESAFRVVEVGSPMKQPRHTLPSTGTMTRAKRRLMRSYIWSSRSSICLASRSRVRSSFSTPFSGNPSSSSWVARSGSLASRIMRSRSWSATSAWSLLFIGELRRDQSADGPEIGRFENSPSRGREADRLHDLRQHLEVDRVALDRWRDDHKHEVDGTLVRRVELHSLRGPGQEDGALGDHRGARVRDGDTLADGRAPQGLPLAEHLEHGVGLTRDLMLCEMGDHLLEHRGFLLVLELGNEERGAKM